MYNTKSMKLYCRVRARYDSLNGRLKKFGMLHCVYRHRKDCSRGSILQCHEYNTAHYWFIFPSIQSPLMICISFVNIQCHLLHAYLMVVWNTALQKWICPIHSTYVDTASVLKHSILHVIFDRNTLNLIVSCVKIFKNINIWCFWCSYITTYLSVLPLW